MTKKKREKWVRVWPPLKVVDDPNLFTIEEKGCDECKAYFGWTTCRKGQYSNLDIILGLGRFKDKYGLGYWRDNSFTVLCWMDNRRDAENALRHLQEKTTV